MKIIYNKFDKKTISTLPQVVFPGRIISIISPGETEKAVDYLLSSDILGVDTETNRHSIGASTTRWPCCRWPTATPPSSSVSA